MWIISTPVVWLSDCNEPVLLVLLLSCANITAPLIFKVSVAVIRINAKIDIRKVILNLLVELRLFTLFLFFTKLT